MSRDSKRLAEEKEQTLAASPGVLVQAMSVDAADIENLQPKLHEAAKFLGDIPLDCVLFNTARTGPSALFDFTYEDLESDLKISVVRCYEVAKRSMNRLMARSNDRPKGICPSFLVTSGMLAKYPFPKMFSLAACNPAQCSLITSLHKQFEEQGVHCGLVTIKGTVAEDSKRTNPANIAAMAWNMLTKSKGEGVLEVIVEDPDFDAHVKNRENAKN